MAGHLLGGRYTLLTPIAQGGMGEVWKARDSETGRMVAAKVLRPELSGEELSLSRLRIEARNAMRIQHPNIASVLDSGEEDGRGWIVMELVEGRPLTDYLRGGARVAVEDLVPVIIQVALALDAAAAAGVVHRDIKPANILIRPDGVVKLTDFGISRTTDQANLTAAGMVMGTAQYLPPEQAMGETATSSGDLYALGVIAYEAAAGRRPFTGATQVDIAFSHVNDPVPALPEDIPLPFAKVVLHLLQKEPRHRPATGAALVRELVTAARTLDMPVEPHPLAEPTGDESPTPDATGTDGGLRAAVPPVLHERRRVLPEEMLLPPTTDEGGPHGRTRESDSPAPGSPEPFSPGPGSPTPTGDEGGSRTPARTPQFREPATDARAGDATPPPRRWRELRATTDSTRGVPPDTDRRESPNSDPGTARPDRPGPPVPGSRARAAAPSSDVPGHTAERTQGPASYSGGDQGPSASRATPARRARHAGASADEPRPDTPRRNAQERIGSSHHGRTTPSNSAPDTAPAPRGTRRARTHRPTGAAAAAARPVARRSLIHRQQAPESHSPGVGARPGWLPLHHGSVVAAGTPHRRPPRTRFNRSVVAPPVPLVERIGRWVVIGLIVLTLILIAVATIQNRFGSLTSLMGAGAHVIEEARTCPIPWTTV